jgi:hypothetical protein
LRDDTTGITSTMFDVSSEQLIPIQEAAEETTGSALDLVGMVTGSTSFSSTTTPPPLPAANDETCRATNHNHDSSEDNKNDTTGRIRLGICALDKKARSKPMAEILSRLDETNFQVVFFGDHCILHQPIEEWPVCDALIAFFSKGYPLQKVKEYAALRKPFILNDLSMQDIMKDRRRVYDLLADMGIDVPRHVFVNRDGYKSTRRGGNTTGGEQPQQQSPNHNDDNDPKKATSGGSGDNGPRMVECDDHIEVDGVAIHKPFVEKPVNAEGVLLLLFGLIVVVAAQNKLLLHRLYHYSSDDWFLHYLFRF